MDGFLAFLTNREPATNRPRLENFHHFREFLRPNPIAQVFAHFEKLKLLGDQKLTDFRPLVRETFANQKSAVHFELILPAQIQASPETNDCKISSSQDFELGRVVLSRKPCGSRLPIFRIERAIEQSIPILLGYRRRTLVIPEARLSVEKILCGIREYTAGVDRPSVRQQQLSGLLRFQKSIAMLLSMCARVSKTTPMRSTSQANYQSKRLKQSKNKSETERKIFFQPNASVQRSQKSSNMDKLVRDTEGTLQKDHQ